MGSAPKGGGKFVNDSECVEDDVVLGPSLAGERARHSAVSRFRIDLGVHPRASERLGRFR